MSYNQNTVVAKPKAGYAKNAITVMKNAVGAWLWDGEKYVSSAGSIVKFKDNCGWYLELNF